MAKELALRPCLPLAWSFVAVNGIIGDALNGAFGNSAGKFRPMLFNLATVMPPPTAHSINPMLSYIGAASDR